VGGGICIESIYIQIFVCISKQSTNGCSGPSKGVDFATNRKRLCNFLLVINSNFGRILLRFRDTAGFLLKTATRPLFDPNFAGVVFGLDC